MNPNDTAPPARPTVVCTHRFARDEHGRCDECDAIRAQADDDAGGDARDRGL